MQSDIVRALREHDKTVRAKAEDNSRLHASAADLVSKPT